MYGQAWAQVGGLLDPNNIGLKELLQLFAFGGSVYGAWKWWRFSKWQIANRLFEYLNADEKNIVEARRRVLQRLRSGKGAALTSGGELHEKIESAIKLLDSDQPVEAEQELGGFALMLTGSAEVGRRHTAVASEQAATIFLFIGLIAKQRSDVTAARTALMEARDHWPEDAEVVRALGELDLNAGDLPNAQSQFDKAISLASRDRRLEAEIWALKGETSQRDGDKGEQIASLLKSAIIYAEIDDHLRAADTYSIAGDLQVSVRHTKRARRSFRSAFDCYERAGNVPRRRAMREKLAALKVDVSGLPDIDEPTKRPIPWFWMRLSVEILVLAVALYLTFMR